MKFRNGPQKEIKHIKTYALLLSLERERRCRGLSSFFRLSTSDSKKLPCSLNLIRRYRSSWKPDSMKSSQLFISVVLTVGFFSWREPERERDFERERDRERDELRYFLEYLLDLRPRGERLRLCRLRPRLWLRLLRRLPPLLSETKYLIITQFKQDYSNAQFPYFPAMRNG